MTDREARAIVALLAAGFPAARIEQATVDVYALGLSQLDDFDTARAAATRILRDSERFPTLREIRDAYQAEARARRDLLSEERGLPRGEPAPPPPEWLALGARLSPGAGSRSDPRTLLGSLRELPPGRCDDCGDRDARAARYGYGRMTVCPACATARLTVRARLGEAA